MPHKSICARSALFNNCHDFASKALNNAEGGARWHTARVAALVFLQGRHVGAASGWCEYLSLVPAQTSCVMAQVR